ncbi:hypothetical protein B0J12DRAFT_694150 [Macrophomina phaseolina]|uniref:Uncharacterized protein n=1 Tax=Macrophomina phaseolina TaxID=35725 RepID=A0ABQ8GRW0_9PEZI|nr:hypothetical protein B0J12DRAFT_694150 [Macrophomina phaseolina]
MTSSRIARGEAQRSQKRSIEGNYAYFSRENDGKQCLYRRPIKEHTWRKVLKRGEVFDAIGQAHFDTGHGGRSYLQRTYRQPPSQHLEDFDDKYVSPAFLSSIRKTSQAQNLTGPKLWRSLRSSRARSRMRTTRE